MLRNASSFGVRSLLLTKSKILIEQKNGEILSLPSDLRAIEPAPEGEYRLHSTGEVVVNPDFLSTWTVELNDENNE